jgi:hypothetical protein
MNGEARPPRVAIWLLPHALGLDAPLVALAWQALLAVHTHVPVRFAARAVLALTVWLIYVADRLLDVDGEGSAPQTAPHRFVRRRHRAAVGLLLVIAAADLWLAAFALRTAVLRNGLVLSVGVAGYLAMVHAPGRRPSIPKALPVAVLFTAGTFVAAWTGATDPVELLWAPAISFFLLCLANLVLIDGWEGAAVGRGYPVCASVLAVACLYGSGHAWYRAIGLSAAALLTLFFAGPRLSRDLRRVLADVALLAPLFFLR